MSRGKESVDILDAMRRLEGQRAVLGDEAVDLALAALRQQLPEHQAADAPRRDAREEGERKLVTVVFADVSGFTRLAADLDPEHVRDLMNRCFDRLVPVVSRYEGTVDKFVGDAIIALFGAPVAHENDPERALLASLDMLDELAQFNRENRTDLGLHFGINTGTVVAGTVGSEERQDYSVMGDAVNMAARLEDLSERGDILVGHDTYRLVARGFDFDDLDEVRIKGKDAPVRVYRLRGPKAGGREVLGEKRTPLVGRAVEVARLEHAVASLEGGKGRRIAIVAEAGLGKSRLVAEVREAAHASLRWAEGRGLSHGHGFTYGVARDLLVSLLGIRSDAPVTDVARSLGDAIDRIAPGESDEITPYLARLLDLPLDDERMADKVRYLSGEMLRRRMTGAFRDAIRGWARQEPLVLVWEDLHWADASSLEMLEELFDLPDEIPLLLLLIFRSEPGRALELHRRLAERYGERFELLELVPLSEAESRELAHGYLDARDLPETIRRTILAKAEGNPFFLEEILRSLVDSGHVVPEGSRAVAGDGLEGVEVPDTVQGVIAARIDRLAAADKRTLQAASVIGRIFQRRVLRELLDLPKSPPLDASLEELIRRAFVRLQGAAEERGVSHEIIEYIFQHVITHEVSYNTLLLARRRELHRAAGETIERLFPGQREDLAGTLGFHFQRAEEHTKAADYLLRAGHRAKAQYANEEALGYYRAARAEVECVLAAAPEDRTRWDRTIALLDEGMGETLARIGRSAEARSVYHQGLARLAESDRIGRCRFLRQVGNAWWAERQYPEALVSFDEAERALGAEPCDPVEEWQLEWNELGLDRVWGHYWLGQWSRIFELVETIRPSIEDHGTPLQLARLHQAVSLALMRRDRYTSTDEMVESAWQTYRAGEASGDLAQAAHARFVLGFVSFFGRDLVEAERYMSAGRELAERIGEVIVLGRCLTYLTAVCRMGGKLGEAEEYARRSLDLAREYRMVEYEAAAVANLAWVAWRQGDPEGSVEKGGKAIDIWKEYSAPYPFQWFARWPLLAMAVDRGDLSIAAHHARAMIDASQQLQPETLVALLERAIAAEERGDKGDTGAAFESAIRAAEELGYL